MTGVVGVALSNVSKSYGEATAVRDVSIDIRPGEIISFLGPSGCGKTTTLRMIAGLERPDTGTIEIGGVRVDDLPPWKRNIGMVFQNYALFPHMTVMENITFGLNMRGRSSADAKKEAVQAMSLVRLSGLEERRPSQLSGGQRQRVALARAIVTKPDVLLLDEPLAALDKKLREQMQIEIKQLQQKISVTTVFVTHDQEEALALSDRLVVMEAGRIVQVGTPADIYDSPQSRFVADFIGHSNLFSGRVKSSAGKSILIETAAGELTAYSDRSYAAGETVSVAVRPEKVRIVEQPSAQGNALTGVVAGKIFSGALTYYYVDVASDMRLNVMVADNDKDVRGVGLEVGQQVHLACAPEHLRLFQDSN